MCSGNTTTSKAGTTNGSSPSSTASRTPTMTPARCRTSASDMDREPAHEPVLLDETVGLLAPSRGGLFVDCTVGLGGHSRALLEAGASRVIGLDRDPTALRIAG